MNPLAPYVPDDIYDLYEVNNFRNAAQVLSTACPVHYEELLDALRVFRIELDHIRKAGGNESPVPKLLSAILHPLGWHETSIKADMHVTTTPYFASGSSKKKAAGTPAKSVLAGVVDGHKLDYVKHRVAVDMEWNSKDQTFDRDLLAVRAFYEANIIDAAIIVTRSKRLNAVFQKLGPELDSAGMPKKTKSGNDKLISSKYGASTTWMGKLTPRIRAGRNGGCPILAIGITEKLITDWEEYVTNNP
jgi:CRISPR-associated protein Csd2